MRTSMITGFLVVLFCYSLSARLEWPEANPEGGLCGISLSDPLACPDGFVCDMSGFEKRGYGVCKRPEDVLVGSLDAPKQENTPGN